MKRIDDKIKRRIKRKRHIRKRVSGTPERPRMCVYRSNTKLYVQVIDDSVGNTLVAACTLEKECKEIKNNVKDAEKLGNIIGKRCKEKKISSVVFDRNGYLYHGIVKAIADGARKAGIDF